MSLSFVGQEQDRVGGYRPFVVSPSADGFSPWVLHFQQNAEANVARDARTCWNKSCALSAEDKAVLVASAAKFQLGESGDGRHLLRHARQAGDEAYSQAAQLFIKEEQSHAALLLQMLGRFGSAPISQHWISSAFVVIRHLSRLKAELMVLTCAEVIALSYYGALAECPDGPTRAVARRIVDDEHFHVQFQVDGLRAGFAGAGRLARRFAALIWWVLIIGTTAVVLVDHGGVLGRFGPGRRAFVLRVMRDFATVARAVLGG